MPRTIVYEQRPELQPPPGVAPPSADTSSAVAAAATSPAATAGAAAGTPDTNTTPDRYAEKLVKYIPGEVVALFIPLAALAGDRDSLLIATLIVGLLATPFYLWQRSTGLPKAEKPRGYFFILSMVAFCAWALTTSRLGDVIGFDEVTVSFMFAVAVFAIPALDTLFVAIGMRGTRNQGGV